MVDVDEGEGIVVKRERRDDRNNTNDAWKYRFVDERERGNTEIEREIQKIETGYGEIERWSLKIDYNIVGLAQQQSDDNVNGKCTKLAFCIN